MNWTNPLRCKFRLSKNSLGFLLPSLFILLLAGTIRLPAQTFCQTVGGAGAMGYNAAMNGMNSTGPYYINTYMSSEETMGQGV